MSSRVFVIDDVVHSEWRGQFESLDEARGELQRLATIPWDEPPNRAPCQSWKTCRRDFHLAEYDTTTTPWKVLRQSPVLEISADGVVWSDEWKGFTT